MKALFLFTALLCVSVPPTLAQNLLTNGSFEAGDFSGWTTGGNFEFTSVVSEPFYVYTGAQDGIYYAVMGPTGSDGTLSQSFTTVSGTFYAFSFWLDAVGDDPSDFSADWNGTQLLSLTDPTTHGVWTNYTFEVVATGHDTITFNFRDDPGFIALDNVSMTTDCCGTVPEPSSLFMLGTGLLMWFGASRLRRSRS